MKAINIIHNDIADAYPKIHAVRLKTLFTFIESGLHEQQISVTYLGRGLKSRSMTDKKHDIKRADRLIGNPHLHRERQHFYEYMTAQLVGKQRHPIVIVDWSALNGSQPFQLLRASIPMRGRALTLVEKVYPESQLNSEHAHQTLLDELEKSLPADCQPIIVSDALFRAPWFKAIEAKGWLWVGRVRGNVTLSTDGVDWQASHHYYEQATGQPRSLGSIRYGKSIEFRCHAVLFKEAGKGRKKLKKRGGKSQCTTDKYQQKKAKEPWLLVHNLPVDSLGQAQKVVQIYQQRMQIEENFRDTKNAKLGLSTEFANSKTAERFDNLLLIASIILFILWSIGYAVSQLNYERRLQANTIKHRQVLSFISLGREAIGDPRYEPESAFIIQTIAQLWLLTANVCTL